MLDAPFNYKRIPRTLKDISILEGVPVSITASYAGNLGTGNINQSIGNFQIPFNMAIYVDAIVVGANCPVQLQIQPTGGALNGGIQGPQQDFFQVSLPANGSYRHDINEIVTQAMGTNLGANSTIAGVSVRRLRNADGSDATVANANANITGSLTGRLMYDDLNFGANKIIKFVGDSISRASGRTAKANCWDWKIRSYYADKGIDVRAFMKATSGSTSVDHERWRQSGWHTEPQVDLLVYYLGANDASQAVPAATFGTNLGNFIAQKQRRYPNAHMLVLGVHPMQVAATETAAITMRSQAQTIVANAADPRVHFCDLGQLGAAFRGDNTNYAASDGAGTGVHPSDQGDNYFWNGNVSAGGAFTGLKAFLDANIPNI